MPSIDDHLLEDLSNNVLKHHSISIHSSHTFPTIVSEASIRNSLIYLLLGFNTTHIYEDSTQNFIINPNYSNHSLIHSFTNLAFTYRKIKIFIRKMSYGCSCLKTLVTNHFIERVNNYQKKVSSLINAEIEEIYLELHIYALEFKEYADLIETVEDIENLSIFNIIVDRFENGVNYYEELIDMMKTVIYEDVLKWCKYGDVCDNLFILMNKGNLQFDESYYKNTFVMCDNVPKFLEREKNKIFQCGVMKNLLRRFDRDNSNEIIRESNSIDEIFTHVNSLYQQNISILIKSAICEVYTKYFVKDINWISDLMCTLGNKMFEDFETVITDYSKKHTELNFKSAESRINHFILKILNVEKFTKSTRLNVFENLQITIFNKTFGTFFSQKIIFELEIIFRFLYQLTVFDFYFCSVPKNNFVIKARLFLQYYKSAVYLNYIDPFQEVLDMDQPEIVTKFEEFIKYMLKQFYFTQMPIFTVLSEIFDVFFEYVYTKGDCMFYLNVFNESLERFMGELKKSGSTPEFLFYLEILK